MTVKGLREELGKKNDDEVVRLLKKLGYGGQTRETFIQWYVDHPEQERTLCHQLGLKTEDDKRTDAAIRASKTAMASAFASVISAAVALVALLLRS